MKRLSQSPVCLYSPVLFSVVRVGLKNYAQAQFSFNYFLIKFGCQKLIFKRRLKFVLSQLRDVWGGVLFFNFFRGGVCCWGSWGVLFNRIFFHLMWYQLVSSTQTGHEQHLDLHLGITCGFLSNEGRVSDELCTVTGQQEVLGGRYMCISWCLWCDCVPEDLVIANSQAVAFPSRVLRYLGHDLT